jgi:hypothetical protein
VFRSCWVVVLVFRAFPDVRFWFMRGRGLGPRVAAGTARGSTGRVPVAGLGSSFLLPGPGPGSGEAGREYGGLGFPGDGRLGRTGVTQVNEFADSPRVTARAHGCPLDRARHGHGIGNASNRRSVVYKFAERPMSADVGAGRDVASDTRSSAAVRRFGCTHGCTRDLLSARGVVDHVVT